MISRAVCTSSAQRGAGWLGTHPLLAAVAAALFLHNAVGAQTPTRAGAGAAAALARASDAVVTIVAYRDGSSEVTSGTGVRVADGRVLTALRYLRGASRAEVFNAAGDVLGTVTTLEQAEVKLDLAVLPRGAESGGAMILARRSAVLTQKLSVIGPKKSATRSVVERTVTHVEPDDNGRPLLRLGAAIVGSFVGAPVVNARGEMVAIALGSLPGREDGDIAVDVAAIRELLARPVARLGFPARDGTIAAAKAPVDARNGGSTAAATKPLDAGTKPRSIGSIFPERYGNPISADTARSFAVELFGCARLDSRRKVYCYLLITNLASGRTLTIAGGDLADSAGKKIREAENLVYGDSAQRVSGWRNKATIPLRELDAARVALEFAPPERDTDAVRLILDIAGERTLTLGPFILQRHP
jgi:Trypsin-like peptidase domain